MANQILKKPLFSDLHQPLFTVSDFHQALDRLFDRNFLDLEKDFPAMEMMHWVPKVDIKEKNNQYIIRADLPGVTLKDIDVRVDNGMLIIKGKKQSETKEERDNYVRLERSSGSFYRTISLPELVDESKITAKLKDGVLEIIATKSAKSSAHKINIKEE